MYPTCLIDRCFSVYEKSIPRLIFMNWKPQPVSSGIILDQREGQSKDGLAKSPQGLPVDQASKKGPHQSTTIITGGTEGVTDAVTKGTNKVPRKHPNFARTWAVLLAVVIL